MEFIEQLVKVLRDDVKFVHAFVIALPGSPSALRSTKSVFDMLRLFGEIFSNGFWRNARIVATFYSFGKDAINDRDGKTEETWETGKIKIMKQKISFLKEVSSFLLYHKCLYTFFSNFSQQTLD